MSIDDRLRVVKLAEIECERHANNARASWHSLKNGFTDAATPWRIVSVGAVVGFLAGRRGGRGNGDGLGGKLFGSVAQALITTLGAGVTAGLAAGAAETNVHPPTTEVAAGLPEP